MTKICGRCFFEKYVSLFSKKKSHKDGLQNRCKTCCSEEQKEFYTSQENKLKKLTANREWRKTPDGKLKQRAISSRRRNSSEGKAKELELRRAQLATPEGRGKRNAITAKRRAAKLQATPKWLTKDQLKEIESYYALAKELRWLSEEPLEVDHIVPLQGEEVSGLHVPWNIQILPKKLNLIKSNKVVK